MGGLDAPTSTFTSWFVGDGEVEWGLPFWERIGHMRLKQISFSLGTLIMTIAAAGGVFSPAGEYNDVVRSLLAVGVVLGATYVVRWWVLPPRRRTEAIMLVAGTDVIIALACMSHPDPALGIAGTSVFLVVSMLAAFYCAPAVHALHAVFAAIVMCAIVIRMADEPGPGHLALAVSKGVAPVALVLFVLPMAQFMFWRLGSDAMVAQHDPLTRLVNRRGLARFAPRLHCTTGRVAMIMIDVDEFKRINDTRGHQLGDLVLMQIANRIADVAARAEVAGRSTIAARIGGEEFVVVLDGDIDDGCRIAADLCRDVHAHATPPVTISVGVAGAPAASWNLHDLLRDADLAMYEAKRQGGNRFICSPQYPSRHRPTGQWPAPSLPHGVSNPW